MLILIALLAIGQPPAADVEKPGTATLRGHVLAADTGRPLRKAQGRIFAGAIRENPRAPTCWPRTRAGRFERRRYGFLPGRSGRTASRPLTTAAGTSSRK